MKKLPGESIWYPVSPEHKPTTAVTEKSYELVYRN
jgi:hypothetical protein